MIMNSHAFQTEQPVDRTLVAAEAFLLSASLLVFVLAEYERILVDDVVFVHPGECQAEKLRAMGDTQSLAAKKGDKDM